MNIQNTKKVKSIVVYLLYMVLCHAGNYAVITARETWRLEMQNTYAAKPYYVKTFAAFLILGLIWAGERYFANQASKPAVLTIRILSIAILMILALGWFFIEQITIYVFVDMGPVLAVEIGWLLYGILELLLKRDKTTNKI